MIRTAGSARGPVAALENRRSILRFKRELNGYSVATVATLLSLAEPTAADNLYVLVYV